MKENETGKIIIYRRRFIPDELIALTEDEIIHVDDELILTRWRSLKPRSDIAGGISAYYPHQGFKISKILDHNHDLVYWYCDIIHMECTVNTFVYEDLLLDVVVRPDGSIHVIDADELADALEGGLITADMACTALRCLNNLLHIIYTGSFSELQAPAEKVAVVTAEG